MEQKKKSTIHWKKNWIGISRAPGFLNGAPVLPPRSFMDPIPVNGVSTVSGVVNMRISLSFALHERRNRPITAKEPANSDSSC